MTSFAAAVVASALIVWAVRQYALRRGVMDVPNDRSSHHVPTPRGGGIGIVLPVVAGLLSRPQETPMWAAAVAIFAVAIVGWIDDQRPMSFRPRLAVHVLAGVIMAWVASRLDVDIGISVAAPIAWAWWTFWTVSSINVTNFMDGIDGIIGLQLLVFAGFSAAAIGADGGANIALVAAGAATGFLLFNWPPARIFMGDVGSGAIGVMFVLLGLLTMHARSWSVVHAFLPLMPLFVDEVLSMIPRLRAGHSLTEAHRTHAYQRLVQAFPGHAKVSLMWALSSALGAAWAYANPQWNATFVGGAVALLVLNFALMMLAKARAVRRIASGVQA